MADGPDWVAIATFALAVVTFWLGWQARAQVGQSVAAERNRQREAQILDVELALIPPPTVAGSTGTGNRMAFFHVTAPADRALLDATVVLRGLSAGREWSARGGTGSVAPGRRYDVGLSYEPLVLPGPVNTTPYAAQAYVDLTYRGRLGQIVTETYEWHLARWLAQIPDQPAWRLQRLRIEPNVPGAEPVDMAFDDYRHLDDDPPGT